MRFLLYILLGCSNILLQAQTLEAGIKLPETVDPGKFFTVEVIVKKSNINGFMKYTQVVPKGFEAQGVDLKGGSLTFKDTVVKIIWLIPPSDDAFSFSYKLKANAATGNESSFVARMDYLNGSIKESFMFGRAKFTVSGKNKEAEIEPIVQEKQSVSQGFFYCIQIGAFFNNPDLKGIQKQEIKTIKTDNGLTKYFAGRFKNYDEAFSRLQELKSIGYKDAFITKLKDE